MTAAPVRSDARPAILTLETYNGNTCTCLRYELTHVQMDTQAEVKALNHPPFHYRVATGWRVELRGQAFAEPTRSTWSVLTRPEARARAKAAADGALRAERRQLARLIVKALGPDEAERILALMAGGAR